MSTPKPMTRNLWNGVAGVAEMSTPCFSSPKTHAQAWSRFGEDETNTQAATGLPLTVPLLRQKSLAELRTLCRCAGLAVSAKKDVLIQSLVDPSAPIRLRRHVPVRMPDRQITGLPATLPPPSEVDDALARGGLDPRRTSACLRSALLRGHVPLPNGRLELGLVLHSAACIGCEERELTVTVRDVAALCDGENAHANCGCGAAFYLNGLCCGERHFAWNACSRAHGLEEENGNRRLLIGAGGPEEPQLGVPFLFAATKQPPDWSPTLSSISDEERPLRFTESLCVTASADEGSSLDEPASPSVLVPATPPQAVPPADAIAPLLSPARSGGTDVMWPQTPPLSPIEGRRRRVTFSSAIATFEDGPTAIEREGGVRCSTLLAASTGDLAALFASLPVRPTHPTLLPIEHTDAPPKQQRAKRSTAGKRRSMFGSDENEVRAPVNRKKAASAWERLR